MVVLAISLMFAPNVRLKLTIDCEARSKAAKAKANDNPSYTCHTFGSRAVGG